MTLLTATLLTALLLPTLPACQLPESTGTQAAADVGSVAEVFGRVQGAVVTIRTKGRDVMPDRPAQMASVQGVGSGVLISGEGDILTAAHVIQTADEVVVQFPGGELVPAKVVSSMPDADVARIKLSAPVPEGVTPVKMADSDEVRVGQRVMVVGAPLGITHTLTLGYISARRNRPGLFSSLMDTEFFQTDAAINQGNSGGPMFDLRGQVIGIVSHIMSTTGGSQGLGFAATSNMARDLVVDANPFWSGIDGLLVTDRLAEVLNIPEGKAGLLVQRVAKNSPGYAMGLRGGDLPFSIMEQTLLLGGDIITEVQGIEVKPENSVKIREAITGLDTAEQLELVILRGGRLLRVRGQGPQG